MIIQSKAPPTAMSETADAPPAYDDLGSPRDDLQRDRKDHREIGFPLAGPSTPQSPGTTRDSPVTTNAKKNWFGSGFGSWFGEGGSRKEVKQTIQSLIRDVVKDPASPASISVMQSCVDACQARGLSFESIISEKFIEGHSPLYWAIVKLPPLSENPEDDQVHLLDMLLSFPLNTTTRSEAYLACLLSSDQTLFQRLRHIPGVQSPSVSAAAELLLGEEPEDEILVENLDGDHGEFRVRWNIAQFQKRMRVVGGVGTEFVARGRIWCLAFIVLPRSVCTSDGQHVKAGSWVASVSLLSPSPSTHLEAQFTISESFPAQPPSPEQPPSPSLIPSLMTQPATPDNLLQPPHTQTRKESRLRWPNLTRNTQKPAINLHIKTDTSQLEALPHCNTNTDLRDYVARQLGTKMLTVPLSSHQNGNSLQFDGCTYLNPDASLTVTFDARLAKSAGGECIIC